MIYDVHAHCIPKEFREWLERRGAATGAVPVDTGQGRAVCFAEKVTTGPLRPDLTDFNARIDAIDRMGIDVQVLSGWIDLSSHQLSGSAASEYARAHNDTLAAEAARAPDRFRALGTVPLQDAHRAALELERVVTELGMPGVQIASTVHGAHLGQDSGLEEFWDAAEELQAFILLHPTRPLAGIDLHRFFLENMVARPAESTIALAGLIFSGVFERHPDVKICVVHGGGFAPFQIGRMDQGFRQKPELTARHISKPPSEYLSRIYVDTIVHSAAALNYLVSVFGADHLLMGTDYPFEMGDHDPVTFVRSAVAEEPAGAILGGTAGRLLG
ncbi:MAG: amidohydrolase family protein [Acidimicrobiia bacterium]